MSGRAGSGRGGLLRCRQRPLGRFFRRWGGSRCPEMDFAVRVIVWRNGFQMLQGGEPNSLNLIRMLAMRGA
jgi:hypothetical protein